MLSVISRIWPFTIRATMHDRVPGVDPGGGQSGELGRADSADGVGVEVREPFEAEELRVGERVKSQIDRTSWAPGLEDPTHLAPKSR